MMIHYPQWNYISVLSFMFRCVAISELRLFKRKKRLTIYKIDICEFNTLSHASNHAISELVFRSYIFMLTEIQ